MLVGRCYGVSDINIGGVRRRIVESFGCGV